MLYTYRAELCGSSISRERTPCCSALNNNILSQNMKKTLFLSALCVALCGSAFGAQYVYGIDTLPETFGSGDQLKFNFSSGALDITSDLNVESGTGRLWVGPASSQDGVLTISGLVSGHGTIEFNTWATNNGYADIFEFTNENNTFEGNVNLARAGGGAWGQLNVSNNALSQAVIGKNGSASCILNISGSATLAGLSNLDRITNTSADNVLTLNIASGRNYSSSTIATQSYFTAAGTSATVASEKLSLVKQGAGSQSFSGNANMKSVTVQEGTLSFSAQLTADSVAVQGGTLELNRSGSNRTLNESGINTKLGDSTISNGQIKITEGSVSMSSLAVETNAAASIYFQNAKDITLGKLTGGAGANLTIQRRNGDNNAIDFVQIKGEDSNYSGTITLQHDGSGSNTGANMLVVSATNALTSAKVDLQGPAAGSNVLSLNVEEASLRSLAGSSDKAKVEVCTLGGSAGVSAATLTITGSDDATFSGTIADNVTLKIAKGAVQTLGAATVSKVTNSGTLKVTADSLTLSALTLTSDALIQVKEDHTGTLTTTALTVSGTGAKMYANLVMNSGELTFADDSILTMGCDVNIGNDVTVVLTDAMVQSIMSGNDVEIITGVDHADLGQSLTFIGSGTMSDYVAAHESMYSLKQVGNKIYITPEPATATLSLLALAGLMARRRRH